MTTNNHHGERGKVAVAYPALISMHSLAAPLRNHIERTLDSLADLPLEQWPTDDVHSRGKSPGLYVLDADADLRVFFRRENDGRITIVDVARQEWLDRYFSGNPA